MSDKVKVGFSLTQEAYDALRAMVSNYRGYGEFISTLIIAERDRRRERDKFATLAAIEERLSRIEERLKRLEK